MNEQDVIINGLLFILFPLQIVFYIYCYEKEIISCQTWTAVRNTGA